MARPEDQAAVEVDPRWYLELIESAPDATVLIDPEGRIVLVNRQTERMFGYQREELLGAPIETLVPERLRRGHSVHRDGYFSEPKVREMGAGIELLGRRRDASEFPVEISLSPLRTERGLYATASIRDATDRRKANEKFRALLETAPDAMVIIDGSGSIMLVNAQAERLFGYQREALIGRPVEALIPERLRGHHAQHRSGYFAAPKVRGMGGAGLELSGRRKDGSEFPIEISLSPMETEQGLWVTAAIRDVTERKQFERKLADYAENLQRSNQELEQFAYVTSHDLSAPLRSVSGFSQLLKKRHGEALGEEGREYLDFIIRSAAHMEALIAGLLTLSRVGRKEAAFTTVDCDRLLGVVQAQLSAMVQERDALISHDPLPKLPGQEMELHQLFQNLVSNGLKFQPGSNPRVHVSAQREGDLWHFSVRDHGIGIDPQYLDRIFEIFQRLHGTDEYEGTGIGLALCRKIVQHHGGNIWAESHAGDGASFHFTLRAGA
ncbi:MAG TPA: PAS domain S-box protein [Solimonas sp.]|nr:PAS domain S-box protein [Solimonas sp.]